MTSKILIPFKLNNIDSFIDSTAQRVEGGPLSANVSASTLGITTIGPGNLEGELIPGDKILIEVDTVERVRTITSIANNTFAFIDRPFPAGFNVLDSEVRRVKEPDNYYIFASGMTEFEANTIPDVIDSPEKSFFRVYEEMAFGKKIEASKMIKKIEWTTGEVYTQYDDLTDLSETNFYVLNSSNQIFKCIDNNFDAESTVEPENSTATGVPFETADGYRWLLMGSLDEAKNSRLGTSEYITVEQDEDAKAAAIPGALWRIAITESGGGFFTSIGDLVRVTDTRYKLVQDEQSEEDNPLPEAINALINAALKAKNDEDNISLRTVTAYEVINNEVFVNIQAPFDSSFATPSTPLTYEIGARVDVISQTGVGALAFGAVDGLTGTISNVEVIAAGTGYLDALIVIRNLPDITQPAFARGVISPPGGHGFDIFKELYCEYLGLAVDFEEQFDELVKYNQVGLLKNPIGFDNEPYLANSFDQLIELEFVPEAEIAGTFEPGDLVFGNDTRTVARVAFVDEANELIGVVGVIGNEPFGSELLKTVEATYDQNEQGEFSPVHKGVVNVQAMDPNAPLGDIKIFSGDIMYLNNIVQVDRSLFGSKERIKMILRF